MSKSNSNATSSSSAMSPSFQLSEQALRDIVLDYLLHNSFLSTARTFALESGVHVRSNEITGDLRLAGEKEVTADAAPDSDDAGDAMAVEEELEGVVEDESEDEDDEMSDGDEEASIDMDKDPQATETRANFIPERVIELANIRRDIRVHILSGRVDEARTLLHLRFPEVLGEDDESTPLPVGGGGRVSEARSASTTSTVNIAALLPRKPAPHDRVPYTSQKSIKPMHIALNLRILGFIEAARTIPLPYADATLRSFSHTTHPSSHAPVPEHSSDAFSAHQTALLHKAQKLYATVESLRDQRDREIYRRELNGVGGLLAYPEPEKSPIAHYLKQERRDAVAEQVNSAIVYHLGQPATSHLELYVRQNSTVWSVMHDNSIALPPSISDWPVDPAVLLSAFSHPSNEIETEAEITGAKTGSGDKKKDGKEKKEGEVAPYFDFEAFVRL